MTRAIRAIVMAAALLWTVTVTAQGRNFAGTWSVDVERTMAELGSGGAMRSGGGGIAVGAGAVGRGGRGGSRSGGGAAAGTGSVSAGGFAGGGGVARGGGGRGGFGPGPTTIAMGASTFTIGSGETSTVYKVDGSTSTIQTSRGEVTAKASWKGDRFVIETASPGPDGPIVTTAAWYLDGEALVRETGTPGADGQTIVRKTFYKRA